jgi:dTDP-4-amino-4,6-dideoxygalactose transaminase
MKALLLRLTARIPALRKVDFVGAAMTPADAWDVWRRMRRGEELLEGPHIAAYERTVSEYFGAEAITFGGARMALYAILKAMGLGPGDEVILPGYNCIVIPNAIQRLGIQPVYVDVARKDYNIVPELAERAITSRTRAILAQHTFGIACDLKALLDIGQRHGIPVIEDGAHAIGARWDGRLLGTFGYACFFSTQETKMINTGFGGFALTADRDLARGLRQVQEQAPHVAPEVARAFTLRWCFQAALVSRPLFARPANLLQGWSSRVRLPVVSRVLNVGLAQYWNEVHSVAYQPYPTRLPNLLAYAGLLQLRQLDAEVAHRQDLAQYLAEQLPELGAEVPEYDRRLAAPSWVRYPFVVADRAPWRAASRHSRFYPGVWLNDPIHPRGSDWKRVGYRGGSCPNAEYLSDHILNLPIDRRVGRRDLAQWLDCCRAALKTGAESRAVTAVREPRC